MENLEKNDTSINLVTNMNLILQDIFSLKDDYSDEEELKFCFKILLFDDEAFNILSPLLKIYYLRDYNISMTLNIKDAREKISDIMAIYIVSLTKENLDYIYDHVKGRPEIILMLGSEIQYEGEQSVGYAGLVDIYRAYNPILQEFAEDHERMHTINITDFIHSQNDFEYCINHFSRNVYYKIAGEIVRIINDRF